MDFHSSKTQQNESGFFFINLRKETIENKTKFVPAKLNLLQQWNLETHLVTNESS